MERCPELLPVTRVIFSSDIIISKKTLCLLSVHLIIIIKVRRRHSGQVNCTKWTPTAFCSRIMSLGTNDTWTKWKILSSGRFWFLRLFCPNSRSKFKFHGQNDFLANKATNKCNTSISFNFDWKTYFWYYFNNSRSSSRLKGQFEGQTVENVIFNKINWEQM